MNTAMVSFKYNCETNDRNVSAAKISFKKMIEMSQRKKQQIWTKSLRQNTSEMNKRVET